MVSAHGIDNATMPVGTPECWVEGDGPLWPVTESVSLWEPSGSIPPWSSVADDLYVESLLRLVAILLASESLPGEVLVSHAKDRLSVDLLLVAPSACVLSWSLGVSAAKFLKRFLMLVDGAMLAIYHLWVGILPIDKRDKMALMCSVDGHRD